ncbi:MAG: N-glycosylase/DNA lyase [bacterium]|nr:N-glycosylase/DNA lyase [bacterium]
MVNKLKKDYLLQKNKITARIRDFDSIGKNGNNKGIFVELVFCILTPQSKAKSCWAAVERLLKNELLWKGTQVQIVNELSGVRFKYKKAEYIIEARNNFFNRIPLKSTLDDFPDNIETRDYIVNNIKGIGYKEASHFLRNIGKGQDLAILDRHILKNLVIYNVINEVPGSITKNKYFEIENKMIKFSKKVGIPVMHLDLLFWSKETGEIFK